MEQSTPTNFKKMISILCVFVCGCSIKQSKQSPPTQIEGPKLSLSTSDFEKLISPQFLFKGNVPNVPFKVTKIIATKQNINVKKTGKILRHLAWENESLSDSLIKTLLDLIINKIERPELEKLRFMFDTVNELLTLEDSLHKKRIKLFMSNLLDILYVKKDNKDKIPECREWIRHLQRLNESNNEIRNWLRKNESKWQWVPKWYNNKPK